MKLYLNKVNYLYNLESLLNYVHQYRDIVSFDDTSNTLLQNLPRNLKQIESIDKLKASIGIIGCKGKLHVRYKQIFNKHDYSYFSRTTKSSNWILNPLTGYAIKDTSLNRKVFDYLNLVPTLLESKTDITKSCVIQNYIECLNIYTKREFTSNVNIKNNEFKLFSNTTETKNILMYSRYLNQIRDTLKAISQD